MGPSMGATCTVGSGDTWGRAAFAGQRDALGDVVALGLQHLTEASPGLLAPRQRDRELVTGDRAVLDQHVAETRASPRGCAAEPFGVAPANSSVLAGAARVTGGATGPSLLP